MRRVGQEVALQRDRIDGTVFWSTADFAFEKISLTRVQGDYGLAVLKYGPFTYMTTVVI